MSARPRLRYVVACLLLWMLGTIYFLANAIDRFELHVTLSTHGTDLAQAFYSRNGQWNEAESVRINLVDGSNDVSIPLVDVSLGDTVRFDPGQKPETYLLTGIYWTRGADRIPVDYRSIVNAHANASELVVSDDAVRVSARDEDPQLYIPTPSFFARMRHVAAALAISAAGALVLLAAVRRRVALPVVAAGVIACCAGLYFYVCVANGPRLPLYDDWRYVFPGRFNLINGWDWLRAVGNDTYFLTNQLIDFVVLKLTNVDFFALRLVAVVLLLLQIGLQIRILLRTTDAWPFAGAVEIAAVLASLGAGAYWSTSVIAYQQALPTLFGTLLLGLFVRDANARWHTPAVVVTLVLCCVASGLAYISGGLLLASLGAAAVFTYTRRATGPARAGWFILAAGLGLLILQFTLVTLQQGSLLEHSHRADNVFPTDRRFWIFFTALFGRALGYRGTFLSLDVLCTLIVLLPGAIVLVRRLCARDDADTPHAWTLLALYAALGSASYAAIVAFGRAGFAPATIDAASLTTLGKSRFHFWPIATMAPYAWLGWMACLARWPRYRARAVAALAAAVLAVPKSLASLENAALQTDMAISERDGAHCAVAHLEDAAAGRPVVCQALTSIPINIGPTLLMLRDRHAVMYRRLLEEGIAPHPANRSDGLFDGGFNH